MKPRVVVVGSFIQDLSFYAKNFPQPGETVMGEFRPGPGGKGFNQAVAASRAGASTLFIGAVGRDAFGADAAKIAEDFGVEAFFVQKKKEPTGVAGIVINSAGQNEIIVAPGANLALHKYDIPDHLLAGAQVVVCQCESDLTTNAHVLRLARKNGALTVLNPAPLRADFDPAVLRHVDVLIPNESEFISLVKMHRECAALLRQSPFREQGEFSESSLHGLKAESLHQLCRCLQVPIVIITLGARGCFVSQPDGYTRIRPHEVEAIDTTGAGDAFVGGFAAGLVLFKRHAIEAAHFANAVAALAVTLPGTAAAMPKAREITRFLKRRDHA